MARRRVILARHGETELNRLGIIQGSGVDPGLNAEGRAQAAALFAAVGDDAGAVVTSGMARAEETAQPFVEAGRPKRVDPRFREICWGVHEGLTATPDMRARYAELMTAWDAGDLDARLVGAESARELGDRLWDAWRELVSTPSGSAAPDTTLVVMHGRALRALACLVDGRPLRHMNDYPHANAGYYVAERAGSADWRLAERNVTRHLGALSPVNPAAR